MAVEKLDVTDHPIAERAFVFPPASLASLQSEIVHRVPVSFQCFFALKVGTAVRTLVPVSHHFINVAVIGVLLKTRFSREGDWTILACVLWVSAFTVRHHGVLVHVVGGWKIKVTFRTHDPLA